MQVKVKNILMLTGCAVMAAGLIAGIVYARSQAAKELCSGLDGDKVEVNDVHHTGFVTSEELTAEIMPILGNLTERRIADIDLDSLHRYLTGLDKIESARVMMLTNGRLHISVEPMEPVARVWPLSGQSYYVNRSGKRIVASARYRVDVPQIRGQYSPSALLPLLDYMKSDRNADALITMISAVDTTNIILVPAMRGHVVNIGTAENMADKFARLRRFYAEVMPVKGWEYYDTISVKWDNQVVATRRKNKLPDLTVPIIAELENEGDDLETVLAPNPPEEKHEKLN